MHQRGARRRSGPLALLFGLAGSVVLGAASASTLVPALSAWLAPEAAIAAIAVQGHQRLSALHVARATGLSAGQPLAQSDPESVVRALEGDPWIASARTLRLLLPNGTLLVGVEEREPRALLAPVAVAGEARKPGVDPWTAVDAEGRAFARVDAARWPGLPRIYAQSAPAPGAGRDDEQLAEAVLLAASLPHYGIAASAGLVIELPRIETADIAPQQGDERTRSWILRTRQPSLEIWLGATPQTGALERLAELLEARLPEIESSRDEKNPLRIDVRFRDRAILRASDPSLPTGA